MPRYKNDTMRSISIDGLRIPPGEEYETLTWLSDRFGLTKVSDFPMFNPTILSGCWGAPKACIKIPEGVSRFAIHFYVEEGYPIIRFNSGENNPPLKLYPTARWNVRCYERTINDIRIDFGNSVIGRVWVIVEKI